MTVPHKDNLYSINDEEMDMNLFKSQRNNCYDVSTYKPNPWNCPSCTYLNNPSIFVCKMCQSRIAIWLCSTCNGRNPMSMTSCLKCRTIKPGTRAKTISNSISECDYLNRIFNALKYYSLLKTTSEQQDSLRHFANDIYNHQAFIEDLQHLMKVHGDQIQDIIQHTTDQNILDPCAVDMCSHSDRHYRISNDESKPNITDNIDSSLNIYLDIMDEAHYFIFHLFHTGLRVAKPEDECIADEGDEDEMRILNCYDHEFARINKVISSTKRSTQRFDRVTEGNKYQLEFEGAPSIIKGTSSADFNSIIQVGNNIMIKQLYVPEDDPFMGDETWRDKEREYIGFMDQILLNMIKSERNIPKTSITRLRVFLNDEEYDTESIDIDLTMYIAKTGAIGNIATYMNEHPKCLQYFSHFFKERPTGMSFSDIARVCCYQL